MARLLVTGAAGFIGSHLCAELLSLGHEVHGIDDLSGGFLCNVPDDAKFLPMGVGAYCKYAQEVGKKPYDHIYHLAAYAAELLSPHIPEYNYDNNLMESIRLTSACQNGLLKPGGRFVFTSSIATYGHTHGTVTEETPQIPADPYGVAKKAVEDHLRTVAMRWPEFQYTIFRPHNVIGTRQNIADNYRNVAAIFVRQALKGEPLRVFGDGQQTRQFSHVRDVAVPIALAPFTPGTANQAYNVGNDEVYSVWDVAVEVLEALCLPCTYPIDWQPARGEVLHITCSHAKLRRDFPNLPEPLPLKVMVRDLAQWAKTRPIPDPTPFAGIEIEDGLPNAWKVTK